MTSYDNIDDEEQLEAMLEKVDNFEDRKKLRARLREIRDKKMKEWGEKRRENENLADNALKDKVKRADEEKLRIMQQFKENAALTKDMEDLRLKASQSGLKDRQRMADEEKRRKLEAFSQLAKKDTGGSKTTVTTTTETSGGKTVVTKDTGGGGVKESSETKTVSADGTTTTFTKTTKIVSGTPSVTSTVIAGGVIGSGVSGGSGSQTTTTEVKTSPDGTKTTVIKKTQTVTKTLGSSGAVDMAGNAPKGGLTAPTRPVSRSPSAIKQMLLEWTKAMTQEYADKIVITNFSSSWNNGIAFCALIHHFYPDSFDFYALDPKKRRYNFDLAFDTAEKYADIAPLLDTDDMVKMQKPDWKCVFTYVQSFYRKLQKHERNKAMPKSM